MSTPVPTSTDDQRPAPMRQGTQALALGALGVVYGDIGTSPLYTVKEVFAPHTGVALNAENLIGACSALLWALMLVVTLKYVLLVLRADNRGEGGGLALTALAADAMRSRPAMRRAVLLLGVFGATLFYGDSLITPAISVLGAMEGLQLVAPSLGPWAPAIGVSILVALFLVQRFGTHAVGRAFGPVILLWFTVLGLSGLVQVLQHPEILAAFNPLRGWEFLAARGPLVLAAVGALVLALTGAEALYADMGHFGRRPIQRAWTFVVLPGLALNYLGQGALLIGDPQALENPFYRLFPDAALLPVLVLATLAAIIASQAVISGAYSMTRQAMQLGFLPRMAVRFTSASESGQIYMPAVNAAMMVGVVVVVLAFGSSSALAGAYGIAVTMTMLITTLLAGVVVLKRRLVPLPLAVAGLLLFIVVDLALVAGCAVKLPDGGWFTLALAGALFFLMTTWSRGRALLLKSLGDDGLELQGFVDALDPSTVHRVPRTAVYPVADPASVPQALLHNLKHNQVLHQHNVVLTVVFHEAPWVSEAQRLELQPLGHDFWRATVHYGFMDTVDVPRALSLAASKGLALPVFETSYFLSRQTVVPTPGGGMADWRERLFAAMSRHAGGVADFFRLPGNAVVELGTRVQI